MAEFVSDMLGVRPERHLLPPEQPPAAHANLLPDLTNLYWSDGTAIPLHEAVMTMVNPKLHASITPRQAKRFVNHFYLAFCLLSALQGGAQQQHYSSDLQGALVALGSHREWLTMRIQEYRAAAEPSKAQQALLAQMQQLKKQLEVVQQHHSHRDDAVPDPQQLQLLRWCFLFSKYPEAMARIKAVSVPVPGCDGVCQKLEGAADLHHCYCLLQVIITHKMMRPGFDPIFLNGQPNHKFLGIALADALQFHRQRQLKQQREEEEDQQAAVAGQVDQLNCQQLPRSLQAPAVRVMELQAAAASRVDQLKTMAAALQEQSASLPTSRSAQAISPAGQAAADADAATHQRNAHLQHLKVLRELQLAKQQLVLANIYLQALTGIYRLCAWSLRC